VEVAALALLVLGVLLAEPVSRALAAAHWPARDPVGALLVWQAVGLAGGLALVTAGIVYGLAPLGPDLPAAVTTLVTRERDGRAHRYRAVGSREDHVAELMNDALGTAADRGAALARFVGSIAPEERARLRDLLG